MRGNAPGQSSVVGPQYTWEVVWSKTPEGGDVLTTDGLFRGGAVYKATVTLTAAQGWSFAEIKATTEGSPCFIHQGENVTVSHGAGTAGSPLVVTITFPKTGADPVKPNVKVEF